MSTSQTPDAHLKLLTKLEELDGYMHTVLHQFPRIERHLLCASIRNCSNNLIRLTVVAYKRKQKTAALFDMDVELEVLRHLVRKAHRLEYINTDRRRVWVNHINELGRMLGGWIKHETKSKNG